jgi:hypothetical protein
VIRVKAAFFSLTTPLQGEVDDQYLRWHLLDHMPEQYQLPGIIHAQRWLADGNYAENAILTGPELGPVGSVMNYLVGDPVQQTHDDFSELGRRLAEIGRFPYHRPSIQVRMPALLRWYAAPAALISSEVVPFRPHRGVLLIVEEPSDGSAHVDQWLRDLHSEHYPALLDGAGVAGAWMYGSTGQWRLHPLYQGTPQYTTVVYFDTDPLEATSRLRPIIEQRWESAAVRPLFAGPLRTMTSWDAWPG